MTRAPTPGAPMPTAAPPAALPVTSRTALQARAERMLVRAVPQVKYQLMRVGPAGLTGIGVLVAAAVAAIALLLPAHQSVLALRDELTKAGHSMPTTAKPHQAPALPRCAPVPRCAEPRAMRPLPAPVAPAAPG